MKKVTKTHPPKEYLEWLQENAELDCSYDALKGKPAHIALKEHLIHEQGFLCAYTGRSIDKESSHVEHIKPQTLCEGLEDVEYRNLLACFPAGGGDVSYGYGAPLKGGKWDEARFINPCTDNCEMRFSFTWKGRINPTNKDDKPAEYTMDLLQLGHTSLTAMRGGAIRGFFGFSSRSKPLSKSDALKLLLIIDKPNAQGKLRAFCFVLKQLLRKYVPPVPRS